MSDIGSIAKAKLKLKIYTRLYLYIKYKLESKKNKDIPSKSKKDLQESILRDYLEEKEYNLSNANSTDNWLLNSLFNYECNKTTMSDNCKLYLDHYLKPKLYTSKSIKKRKELLISFIENLIHYLKSKSDTIDAQNLLTEIIDKLKTNTITNKNINNIINEIPLIIDEKTKNNISEIAKMSILETLKPGNALDTNKQWYYKVKADKEKENAIMTSEEKEAAAAAVASAEAAELAELEASMAAEAPPPSFSDVQNAPITDYAVPSSPPPEK